MVAILPDDHIKEEFELPSFRNVIMANLIVLAGVTDSPSYLGWELHRNRETFGNSWGAADIKIVDNIFLASRDSKDDLVCFLLLFLLANPNTTSHV